MDPKETPDPLKKTNHFANNRPWCDVCQLPHMAEQCVIS